MEQQQGSEPEGRLSNPRISGVLMVATWIAGFVGYFLGFTKLNSDGPEAAISPVALFAVGVVGVISMVRHSLFHRSDAIRMGWDQGRRNNFQIEVGFANLAIGVPAILAVALDLDVMVQAAFVLAYALYFIQVSVLVLFDRGDGRINWPRMGVMLMQAGLMGYFALSAIASAWNQQPA